MGKKVVYGFHGFDGFLAGADAGGLLNFASTNDTLSLTSVNLRVEGSITIKTL